MQRSEDESMRADRQRITPRAGRQGGFTLVELTMTLIVVIMVLTGVLALSAMVSTASLVGLGLHLVLGH